MRHRCVVILIVLFVNFDLNDGQLRATPGNNLKTIPKCCNLGQGIGAKKMCKNNNKYGDYGKLDFSDFHVFSKNLTESNKSVKDVFIFDSIAKFSNDTFKKSAYNYLRVNHRYYLTEDGILYQEIPNQFHRWHKLDQEHYCIEYILPFHALIRKPQVRFWTILEEKEELEVNEEYIAVGLLVSSVFLMLVLLVYCLLPELRNLGGLVLMAYASSLLVAFVVLATLQIGQFEKAECKGLTYVTYFFFLASFCWMNVMSCDIWWTFRGYAKARPIHRRGERFKFTMYCEYAFGLPMALTIVLAVLDNISMTHMPWVITPNVAQNGCFIEDDSKIFYLYIPMLVLIICNWAFFLMTAFNIWRLHRGTAVLDSAAAGTPAAHRKQCHRLLIYLKLSIIMGINWVMEVVSSFQPHLRVWHFTDAYNVLIGLSIFLIFVCKKKILRKLAKKCHGWDLSWPRSQYYKSRSSHTTDSDISQEAPLQVCPNPKGPAIYIINN